jgi:glycosyltransferase involved in cell wall biosynthesis
MTADPDVSVVMSVYNDARYLPDSVESILNQEGVRFEFITLNDGSRDGSGAVLDAYASRDTRMRVVHQQNQGLTRSLITACSLARGRYIARQDSDDISFPGRLRELAAVLDSFPEAVMTASSCAMMGPNGELLLDVATSAQSTQPGNIAFCHGSLMFRREAYERIGGYRPHFRAAQDIDLRYRLSDLGEIRVIRHLLYAYRVGEESLSASSPVQKRLSKLAEAASNTRMAGEDEGPILEQALRLSSTSSRAKRSEPGTGNYFIGRCLYAKRDRRALAYLWSCAKSDPLSLPVWLALAQALILTRSSRGHDVGLRGIVPRNAPNTALPGEVIAT